MDKLVIWLYQKKFSFQFFVSCHVMHPPMCLQLYNILNILLSRFLLHAVCHSIQHSLNSSKHNTFCHQVLHMQYIKYLHAPEDIVQKLKLMRHLSLLPCLTNIGSLPPYRVTAWYLIMFRDSFQFDFIVHTSLLTIFF